MTVISSDQIRDYILKAVDDRLSGAKSDLHLALRQQQRFPYDHDNNDFVHRKTLEIAVGEAALHKARYIK